MKAVLHVVNGGRHLTDLDGERLLRLPAGPTRGRFVELARVLQIAGGGGQK
jgi:hypothetical protein